MPDAFRKAGSLDTGLSNYLSHGFDPTGDSADAYNGLDALGLTTEEKLRAALFDEEQGAIAINAALRRIAAEHPTLCDSLPNQDVRMRLLVQAARLHLLRVFFPDADMVTEYLFNAACHHQLPSFGMRKVRGGYLFEAAAGERYAVFIKTSGAEKGFGQLFQLVDQRRKADEDHKVTPMVPWKDLGIRESGRAGRDVLLRNLKRVVQRLSTDSNMPLLAAMVDSMIPRFTKGRKPYDHQDPRFGARIIIHDQNRGAMITYSRGWVGPRLDYGYANDKPPLTLAELFPAQGLIHFNNPKTSGGSSDDFGDKGSAGWRPGFEGRGGGSAGPGHLPGNRRGRSGAGSLVEPREVGHFQPNEQFGRKGLTRGDLGKHNAATGNMHAEEDGHLSKKERRDTDVQVRYKRPRRKSPTI